MSGYDAERLRSVAQRIEVGDGYEYSSEAVDAATRIAAAAGDGCSALAIARQSICGVSGPQDLTQARELYGIAEQNCYCARREYNFVFDETYVDSYREWLLAGTDISKILSLMESPYSDMVSLLILQIRTNFGLDCVRDNDLGNNIRGIISDSSRRHVSKLSKALQDCVADAPNAVENFPLTHLYDIKNFDVNTLQRMKRFFANFPTVAFVLTFCLCEVASYVGFRSYTVWRNLALKFELEIRRLSYDRLADSQATIGLSINKYSRSGVLLPYKFVTFPPENQALYSDLRGFRIHHGRQVINAIEPIGHVREGDPIIATFADFEVALCLAFADPSCSHYPSISLEKPPHSLFGGLTNLEYKLFNPKWLAATDLGGSMYCADYMAGGYGSYLGVQSFLDPYTMECGLSGHLARGLFLPRGPSHIEQSKLSSDHEGSRIMLNMFQADFSRLISGRSRPSGWEDFEISHIGFRIDGSGFSNADGNRTISTPNDPIDVDARTGLILSHRLPEIEMAYPVFRRVKLLLALIRGLIGLRDNGLALSSNEVSRLQDLQNSYSKRADAADLHAVH